MDDDIFQQMLQAHVRSLSTLVDSRKLRVDAPSFADTSQCKALLVARKTIANNTSRKPKRALTLLDQATHLRNTIASVQALELSAPGTVTAGISQMLSSVKTKLESEIEQFRIYLVALSQTTGVGQPSMPQPQHQPHYPTYSAAYQVPQQPQAGVSSHSAAASAASTATASQYSYNQPPTGNWPSMSAQPRHPTASSSPAYQPGASSPVGSASAAPTAPAPPAQQAGPRTPLGAFPAGVHDPEEAHRRQQLLDKTSAPAPALPRQPQSGSPSINASASNTTEQFLVMYTQSGTPQAPGVAAAQPSMRPPAAAPAPPSMPQVGGPFSDTTIAAVTRYLNRPGGPGAQHPSMPPPVGSALASSSVPTPQTRLTHARASNPVAPEAPPRHPQHGVGGGGPAQTQPESQQRQGTTRRTTDVPDPRVPNQSRGGPSFG